MRSKVEINWWDRMKFNMEYEIKRIPTMSGTYYIEVKNRVNGRQRISSGLIGVGEGKDEDARVVDSLIKQLKLEEMDSRDK